MSSLSNVTARHVFFTTAGLAALLALSGCRETVTCAENPSSVCPDAAGPGMDANVPPDAFVRPDANQDAPGLDAWEPDAFVATPDDAWAPDAGTDGGPCSRCPSTTPVCMGGVSCVECVTNTDCTGNPAGPACDPATNECVPCNVGSDCTAPLAACLDHVCIRCDDRMDCTTATDLPFCLSNNCVQCENRADCTDNTGFPACTGNACVQCEANTDCNTAAASRCAGSSCAPCTVGDDSTCSHIAGANRCVAGTCRQCTVATEAIDCASPATSCNPLTNTCGSTPRGSRTVCTTCAADSECGVGLTCAAVNPARGVTGNYCLPIRVTTCGALRPHSDGVNGDVTDLGPAVNYCRPSTTTCEAILQHRTAQGAGATRCGNSPDGTSNDACGVAGVMDGLCRTSTGGDNLCTHPCVPGSDNDCRTGFACTADGSVALGGYCRLDL